MLWSLQYLFKYPLAEGINLVSLGPDKAACTGYPAAEDESLKRNQVAV